MSGTKAEGANGSEGGTSSWEAVSEIVQLGKDRHQDDGGEPVRETRGVGLAQKRLDPQATRQLALPFSLQIPGLHTFPRGFVETPTPRLLPQHRNLEFSQGNYLQPLLPTSSYSSSEKFESQENFLLAMSLRHQYSFRFCSL